jgi:uncharacterized membrane protein (DUF2068 family)
VNARSKDDRAIASEAPFHKKRAPTLYAIIAFKLLKGLLFVAMAIIIFNLSDNDLPADFQKMLHYLKVNPERKFFVDLAAAVGKLTESKVIFAAVGTLVYSLFSLVEGIGLAFRVSWAGWLAIGESMFFIPIELYELITRVDNKKNPSFVFGILAVNVVIVWYLLQNRHRLFRHHH